MRFFLFIFLWCNASFASVPQPRDGVLDLPRSLAKENDTIFTPTLAHHLRDFHSDRPGSTNSPYTIDAGHFQFEIELINDSRYSNGDEQLNYPNPNLRIGVTNSTEIDVGWVPATKISGVTGIGDLNLRFKRNLLGNDGGACAWGFMPGVKIPTNSNGVGNKKLEPMLMIPLSFTLKNKWAISLMPEVDLRKNALNDGMHSEFVSPFTFGHHLSGIFDGYFEFVTHSSNDANAPWINYLGMGMTARTSMNTQFDVGINLGLNAVTARYNSFAGYVVRL